MDYFKEVSNLKPRKESLISQESTSSANSFYKTFQEIEEEEFTPPKLRAERKISVEQKIPETFKEIISSPIKERKRSDESKSITQKIKEFLGPKPKEKKEENILAQDEKRTIEEIITSKGFKCETHFVTTEDGYKLKIFRIPGDKNENIPDEKRNTFPPVLLQHGIFDSSDGWVCNGEEHSIAFVLAKNNFDVWLSNSRGNKYCKSHEKYNSQNYEFWQFSFNEMGLYDIPAVIKYIKEKNKSNEKIIYFGHSQGTTSMFSGLIQKYDFYKENIKLFVALAPIARLNHLDSTLLSILSKISMHKLLNQIELLEICPNSEGTQKVLNFMDKYANGLTNFVLGLISDEDSKQCNDKNAMSVYLNHYPCGCSLKCLIHFIQIIDNKKFVFFDYQKEANFHIYNQIVPPEYDFSKIKDIPIILIGGENDKLSTREDIKWLVNELKENVIYAKIVENMGHLSFLIGKEFTWFNDVLKIIIKDFYVEKAL
jgi:lysosomal acid lipase/cholesteryl ester hydrolase